MTDLNQPGPHYILTVHPAQYLKASKIAEEARREGLSIQVLTYPNLTPNHWTLSTDPGYWPRAAKRKV